jgi:hypothetical protein
VAEAVAMAEAAVSATVVVSECRAMAAAGVGRWVKVDKVNADVELGSSWLRSGWGGRLERLASES